MVHMGPQHTQCGRKPARLAPVLQMGLKSHKRPLREFKVKVKLKCAIARVLKPLRGLFGVAGARGITRLFALQTRFGGW